MALNKLTRGLNQLSQSFGTRLGGAPFTPSTLPGYFDSLFSVTQLRSTNNLWQDTGETVQASANTNPVRRVVTGARDYDAPSDAARPLLYDEGSSRWSLSFDGTDDCLRLTHTFANTAGSLVAGFVTGTSFAARRVLFGASDPSVAATWWEVGVDTDGRLYWEYSLAGVVQWAIKGSSFLEISTAYTLYLTRGATDFYAVLDGGGLTGVEQNPLTVASGTGPGVWMGAATGLTELAIGGTVTSGGLVRPWNGRISALILTTEDIT